MDAQRRGHGQLQQGVFGHASHASHAQSTRCSRFYRYLKERVCVGKEALPTRKTTGHCTRTVHVPVTQDGQEALHQMEKAAFDETRAF